MSENNENQIDQNPGLPRKPRPSQFSIAAIGIVIAFLLFVLLAIAAFLFGKSSSDNIKTLEYTKPYTSTTQTGGDALNGAITTIVDNAWNTLTPSQQHDVCAIWLVDQDRVIDALMKGAEASGTGQSFDPALRTQVVELFKNKLSDVC